MAKRRDVQKGNRIENEFGLILAEKYGYLNDRAERSMRVIPNREIPPCKMCHRFWTWTMTKKHDTFERFDFVSKHPEFPVFTIYTQVATRWKHGADRKLIEEFPGGAYDIVIMVRRQDRKPFEIRWWTAPQNGVKEWVPLTMEEFFLRKKFMQYSCDQIV